MCPASFFFHTFTLYAIILCFSTYYRNFITRFGSFYIFCNFLIYFCGITILLMDKFVLFQATSELVINIASSPWLTLDVHLHLKVDTLSYFFVLLISVIGLATNFYILNYFKYQANENTFILLINWFMFSMLLFVLANNLFTLFLGWEAIGLSSFFLINFWSNRRGTFKASFKAFCFNKISDVFLLIFILLVNSVTSVSEIGVLNQKVVIGLINVTPVFENISLSLLICSIFKSAQIIGHLWLPDSMEAPVPASALIHSATLVSAGVYLLLRFNPLVSITGLQMTIMFIGSLTAAYGAIVSAAQTDMKKLLAYSTISHCGFLFVMIGAEAYASSIIYLFLHGLFKAATFFCVGSFIRVSNSQDTRQMGALNRVLPVDTIFLIITSFNLGGLPFSSGYTFKLSLIAASLTSTSDFFVTGFCFVGLLISIVYVYRLVYYSAFDIPKSFFSATVYSMQQKQNDVTTQWSLTSIMQIISMFIIISFSGWIYIYLYNLFITSDFIFYNNCIVFSSDSSLFSVVNYKYKYFFYIYYFFFIFIVLTIYIVCCRVEYSFVFKLEFLTSLALVLFFIIFYNFLLSVLSVLSL